MKNTIYASLVLSLLIAGKSFATTGGSNDTFYIKYNFSCTAFGKYVASVNVHSGTKILKDDGTGSTYWYDIHDVSMQRMGTFGDPNCYYLAKATVQGFSWMGMNQDLGPVVQYFVAFSDGSQMNTVEVPIPVLRRDLSEQGEEDARTQAIETSDAAALQADQSNAPTSAVELDVGYVN